MSAAGVSLGDNPRRQAEMIVGIRRLSYSPEVPLAIVVSERPCLPAWCRSAGQAQAFRQLLDAPPSLCCVIDGLEVRLASRSHFEPTTGAVDIHIHFPT